MVTACRTLLCMVVCLFFIQGCNAANDSPNRLAKIKYKIKAIFMGNDRDVYEPIREGAVTLDALPNGPELMTWQKYYQQRYEWHKQTYVANYKQFGHRSPVWDHAVYAMLDEYALFRREHTDAAFRKALLEKVDRILIQGCNDPRIISMKGILLYNAQNSIDAVPFLTKGLALLEQSQYPKRYAFFAASHLSDAYSHARGSANPRKGYHRAMLTYLGQAAADADYANGNQRFYIEDFLNIFDCDDCRLPENAEVCMQQINASPQVDPWIQQTAKGIYHIAYGWKFRGTGYAASVSKAGWKKFKAELEIAHQCLTKAYELQPNFPESSANLITIAMTTQDTAGATQWFDRAIRAHFDYAPAYKHMFWTLRPRWGGSHDDMLKLGIECLNTGRFDTRVPRQFLVQLFQIGDELDNWRAPYQWPGIYDLIQKCFDGLLNEPSNQKYYDENKSFYVVVAWAAGQYNDARRIKQELGDRFDPQAYSHLNVTEEQVLNDLK